MQTIRSAYRRGRPPRKIGGGRWGWRGIANLWPQQQKALALARSSLFSFSLPLPPPRGPHVYAESRLSLDSGTAPRSALDSAQQDGRRRQRVNPAANHRERDLRPGPRPGPRPPAPLSAPRRDQNRRTQRERQHRPAPAHAVPAASLAASLRPSRCETGALTIPFH